MKFNDAGMAGFQVGKELLPGRKKRGFLGGVPAVVIGGDLDQVRLTEENQRLFRQMRQQIA